MDDDQLAFALPPFKAAEALVGLKRQLRDLRELAERGQGFTFGGCDVIELALDGDAIHARLARRPGRQRTEWGPARRLAAATDVRRFVDEVRQQMRRWEQED